MSTEGNEIGDENINITEQILSSYVLKVLHEDTPRLERVQHYHRYVSYLNLTFLLRSNHSVSIAYLLEKEIKDLASRTSEFSPLIQLVIDHDALGPEVCVSISNNVEGFPYNVNSFIV